jgi:hypothetical protein
MFASVRPDEGAVRKISWSTYELWGWIDKCHIALVMFAGRKVDPWFFDGTVPAAGRHMVGLLLECLWEIHC